MQAILGQGHVPSEVLAINIDIIDAEQRNHPSYIQRAQLEAEEIVKSNENNISALLAVTDILKNHPAAIGTLEVSIGLEMHTNSTADTILKSFVTTHLAHAFSTFIKRGWPTCFKTLLLIWYCKGEGASNCYNIDATHLLTRLPSTLRTYKNHQNVFTDESITELEADINRLIQEEAILSAWCDQSLDPDIVGRKKRPFLEEFTSQPYGRKKVSSPPYIFANLHAFSTTTRTDTMGRECRRGDRDRLLKTCQQSFLSIFCSDHRFSFTTTG